MPTRILFLDDSSERRSIFRHVHRSDEIRHDVCETAAEAIELLTARTSDSAQTPSPYDIAYLDHDLGDQIYVESGPGTGFEVAQFIAAMDPQERPRQVVVHSHNPDGARRMVMLLEDHDVPATWVPFAMLAEQWREE